MKRILILLLNIFCFIKTQLIELSKEDFHKLKEDKKFIATSYCESKKAPRILLPFLNSDNKLYAIVNCCDRYFYCEITDIKDADRLECQNHYRVNKIDWYYKISEDKRCKQCIIL